MWLSNGLHHRWCGAGQCYFVSEECACNFCGCAGVDKYHLLRCEWASCEQMSRDNIRQIVKVLHAGHSMSNQQIFGHFSTDPLRFF